MGNEHVRHCSTLHTHHDALCIGMSLLHLFYMKPPGHTARTRGYYMRSVARIWLISFSSVDARLFRSVRD